MAVVAAVLSFIRGRMSVVVHSDVDICELRVFGRFATAMVRNRLGEWRPTDAGEPHIHLVASMKRTDSGRGGGAVRTFIKRLATLSWRLPVVVQTFLS